MTRKESAYMHWAKTCSQARFNLASSGVASLSLGKLQPTLAELELFGQNSYGYAPLQQAIADHAGAPTECVVQAEGTSMANHLVMAALLEPGDEVLMEQPTYGLLLDLARYLRADVKRFHRRAENGWALDPEVVRRALSPRTKLIVLTNPHNPTSVLSPAAVLEEVHDMAAAVGAWVLVDEVYLDAIYDPPVRSSFRKDTRFVITNSLTKAYGLSGLRCGWILADVDLASKIRRLNDLFASVPVHPGEILSLLAFARLPELREIARGALAKDRQALFEFISSQPELEFVPTNGGTTTFPRLRRGKAEEFVTRLRDRYETTVVPGLFFEAPEHFRIGMGVDHAMFVEGLERIDRALRL